MLVNLARDLALAARQPEATVLLTIDQAEELFGYTASEPATRFLRLLRAGLETADRRLMAIATLRSDFLGDFQNHPVLQDGEYPHHFRYRAVPVDPMLLRQLSPRSSRVRRGWPGCSSTMGWSRPWWPTPARAMRCPCWPSRCVACMSASAATAA